MAMNIDQIKQRLASFEKKGKQSSKSKDSIWKPQPGKQVVRIVPYQYQPDNPFIELKFHYDFAGKNYLSPSSFNQPDPIVELSDKLKKSGDKEQWKTGRGLEPKMRTFVPVIVRGEEDKGVRFWGFGVTVYKSLMAAMSEPDYGDITDLNAGFDIQVEFKTAKESGKDYPDTQILIKPKQRPAIDPTLKNVKELMDLITTKQPNILEVYEPATYETLTNALEEYLRKAQEGAGEVADDSTPEAPTEEQIAAATSPAPVAEVKATPAPTAAKAAVSPTAAKSATQMKDLTAAFDTLFNS
jgi:hypothetical protein